jgi:RNA polymerase subunit RPABC4/transcription elongation factor Spt4
MTPIIDISVWVMVDGTKTEVDPDAAALEDVDVDTMVIMVFSEALNESTLAYTLDSVSGDKAWDADNTTATFTPDANLTEDTEYTLTITTDVTNATDAAILPRDTGWTFKTHFEPPTVTPTITPADGATDQAVDVQVSITFDYEMNQTATEAAITAAFGTGFTWTDNKTVVIDHADFTQGSSQTVSISTAGKSVEGYKTIAATSTFTIVLDTWDYDLGTVKDEDGAGVANANVDIKDSSGNSVWTGQTDSDGKISFSLTSPLAEGDYTVTVSKTGYEDIEFTFSVDANGDVPVTPTIPVMKASGDGDGDDEEEDLDMLPIILIIVVIIIIVVLLALAMRPKKAAEEELEEEEGEMEEGMEEEEFECPECGAAVTSGEAVCPECGAEFEEEEFECPECGARIEAGVGLCPECGAEFETEEEEMMEEGEEELEDEELEDYEIEEEEEFEEEEMEEGEEEMEDEELEEDEEELPEDEEELSEDEEESEEDEEELD